MREGWRRATLGELFDPSNTRLGEHVEELPVFSISKYQGVMPAEEFFDKRVASANLANYKLLSADAWVYSTIHIDEGSIACNNTGVDGVVSPMYTVMNWESRQDDPRYLEHLLRSKEMLATYSDNAQGSVNRRRSLPWKAFRAIEIALPPLDEQRRTVDLLAALDDAIEAAEGEATAATGLLDAALDAAVSDSHATVGEVATISSGASWGRADVRTADDDDALPVLTIANTKPDGSISGGPTYVAGLSEKTGRLSQSSIVVIRTNGNHNRIGNVYRVEGVYLGAAVSAFQLIIGPTYPDDSRHLFWMLRRPKFQAEVTAAASGSTGLGNIAATKLRAMEIPWPADVEARAAWVALYEDMADSVGAARATADALRNLRSNLLTVLLSGEHEIPASYEALLEVA